MKRSLLCLPLLLVLVAAQQSTPTAAWDVTVKTNTVADSTLTVENRCQKNHQFQTQLTNLPFLHFSTTQVNVKGGATQLVPVKFDTRNLAPGVYQGTVLVICQSCKGEASCTQDREVLTVVLRVTSDAPESLPPNAPTANRPANTPPIVSVNPSVCPLLNQIVHVERDPANMDGDLWLVKIKTADGTTSDIYVRSPNKPSLRYCNWIRINECQKDSDGETHVGTYQLAEDPTKPCALMDQIVHVEGDPLRLPDGRWQIKIKTRDGKASFIYVRSATKPNLKFCNWIKIGGCQKADMGGTNVDGYDPADDPTKPPPTPTPTPAAPPVTSTTPRTDPPPPPPCKNGAIRNLKKEKKEFVYADDDSVVEFSSSSTSAKGKSAALSMAELWRAGAKIGGAVTGGLATSRGSAHAIGFVFDYLNKGADILEKLADSPISVLNAGVSAKVAITTKKATVTCTTFEVCENGTWVRKAILEKVVGSGPVHKASKRAHLGDPEREKVQDSSRPQFLDPDKVDKWLRDFLAGELNKLRLAEKEYADFVKNCK